jgi:hypothetical protein
MEVYILDNLLRRVEVVDKFESLIWTERFAAMGEFELLLPSSNETRSRFTKGKKLAINNSHRVMTVETTEDTTDEDGKAMLKVRGPSLEAILQDRVAKDTMSNLTTEPKWVITDTPGNIARTVFNDICVLGNLDPDDIIPFMTVGSLFPADTIPESSTTITASLDLQTVYDAVKGICDLYDLGFRLTRNFDTSQLFFNIYSGRDRTSNQSVDTPVIFSPNLDNLKNTVELTTIEKSKNVAYVFSPDGFAVVYASWVDATDTAGFERRVLTVKADDITTADYPDVPAALEQRGLEELSKARGFTAFDGELNQNSEFVYGVDYNLGDLVEMRNVDGIVNQMRVTEQIFVDDAEGERSYPTLTISQSIELGSWLASEYYNRVWEDWGATEYWADQP